MAVGVAVGAGGVTSPRNAALLWAVCAAIVIKLLWTTGFLERQRASVRGALVAVVVAGLVGIAWYTRPLPDRGSLRFREAVILPAQTVGENVRLPINVFFEPYDRGPSADYRHAWTVQILDYGDAAATDQDETDLLTHLETSLRERERKVSGKLTVGDGIWFTINELVVAPEVAAAFARHEKLIWIAGRVMYDDGYGERTMSYCVANFGNPLVWQRCKHGNDET